MSIVSKFLSISVDMMKGGNKNSMESETMKCMNVDKLQEIILWLESFCSHAKLYYPAEVQNGDTGTFQLEVKDELECGIPAQVKLFPLYTGEIAADYNRVNGKLNVIREMTNWSGALEIKLPEGDYYVEISKGSEYEIAQMALSISRDSTIARKIRLEPITNLRNEGWYAGDLHHHSIYSSPVYGGTDPVVESPEEVCCSMMAMGASYGALSDHHNTLNHDIWRSLQSDRFTPIVSKEISTSNGHVLSLGVEEDIIYQIPSTADRTDDYLRNEFLRITKQIKELGGLPQLNHPTDSSKSISWNRNFDDILQIFETMEIWNGSNPMIQGSTTYKAYLMWQELLEQGRYIPATTGSDTHNILANDYHEYFNKLSWMISLIRDKKLVMPDELEHEVAYLLDFSDQYMPILEKWAETNLTSAGVRTYVHMEGEVTQEKLLNSLKQGHSFLTNGPILIPEICGKIPGETVEGNQDTVNIQLKILANRPLKSLYVHTNGQKVKVIPLHSEKVKQKKYDYSTVLSDVEVKDVKFIYFRVEDDCTNMAITNPIFFE